MRRLKLLDLFCGAGGCSVGYSCAGFDVTGVDKVYQPNYPFKFYQGDALSFPLDDFDVIHASPPCQAYTYAAGRPNQKNHDRLIAATRERIQQLPYIIENVEGARSSLINPIMLCGSNFGLRVRRHRYFEVPLLREIPKLSCNHKVTDMPFDHGYTYKESEYRDALGVWWMLVRESRQAIPPAYTEYLGRHLLSILY